MCSDYDLDTPSPGHKGMIDPWWSCSNCLMEFDSHLNRRRYAQNDETLYVAPEDDRTDYVRASALEQSQ